MNPLHIFRPGCRRRRPLLPLVLLMAALCSAPGAAQAQGLQVTYGSQGLATLTYNGVNLVDTNAHGSDAFTVYEYERVPAGGTAQDYHSWDGGYASAWDAARDTLTWTYAWGSVACRYAATANALNMTITVRNTTPGDTINGVDVFPVAVRFPAMPAGFSRNAPQAGWTSDGPNVQVADYGAGVLDLCNTDVVKNLYCGFFPVNNNASPYTTFTVWASSLPLGFQPPSYPVFDRPVAPGQSDTYTLSLRFGAEGAGGLSLAGDVLQHFAAAWPSQVHWTDHRSIGALFLATSQAHPPTNPRGWFSNDPSVDTTTPAGIQAFGQRVMQYAQTSIGVLKQMNAQGMIQWDVEGQQYAQPTSYIGDPTLLSTLAPEMDAIADQYFAAFKSAGFRVGLCVRPQQFQLSPTAQQNTVGDPASEVIAKINYARQRWGCTLFYVDSNVDTNGGTLDASVFQQIASAEPGVLVIPEHSNTKYYAYSSPYAALTNGALGATAEAAATYPGAFSSIYTADGDMTDNYNTLVQNVHRGDLLLFRSWFDDEPGNGQVRDIYASAGAGLPVITSASTASGAVGAAFSYQITATNGPTSFAAAGLPAGLSVNTSTGFVSGTPTAAGSKSVTLSATNAGGTGTRSATITVGASAATPYNVSALWTPGTTITGGGADSYGNAYNDSLVGTTVTYSGSADTLGPANAADAWSNVTVTLPAGTYTKLKMVGSAVGGTVTGQVFVVNYTDGTTQSFTQSLSDWGSTQGYAGETVVNAQTTRLASNGSSASVPTYIYGYTFALSGKPVKSITLPNTRQVIAFGFKGSP